MNQSPISRRDAVKKMVAGAAAFQIVPRHVLGGPGYTPPSEKIYRAMIGVGNQGSRHFGYPGGEVIAVCEVKQSRLEKAHARIKNRGGKAYKDFREVLERPDIDVIDISTPPHWHGLMCIMMLTTTRMCRSRSLASYACARARSLSLPLSLSCAVL